MDLALEGLLEECKGDQGVLSKINTWPKADADGLYPLYLRHSNPLRLSDEQKVERGACVLHQRAASEAPDRPRTQVRRSCRCWQA
jgi:hypothetical protein